MVSNGVPPVEKIKCCMGGAQVVLGSRPVNLCTDTTPGHLKEMIKNGYKKDSSIYPKRTTNN